MQKYLVELGQMSGRHVSLGVINKYIYAYVVKVNAVKLLGVIFEVKLVVAKSQMYEDLTCYIMLSATQLCLTFIWSC